MVTAQYTSDGNLSIGGFGVRITNTLRDAAPNIAWAWYWETDQGDLLQAPGGSVVTADGDPVGYVPHHNGGGDFRQTTAAAKPTYKSGANGINNLPVLRFDGGDYLRDTALAALTDTQGTIIAVAKRNADAFMTLLGTADESTNISFFRWGCQQTSTNFTIAQVNADSGDQMLTGATNTSPHIFVLESSGTAWTMRKDGANQSLTVASGSNTGDWWGDTASRDSVTIGALQRLLVEFNWTGDIAGMWYSSTKLSASDLAAMETYLSNKYAIAI